MTDREEPRPGRVIGGRYRILETIGRGGRATVFEAQDPLLGRRVALKVFTATATDPEEVRLQEAEARLVASLDHFALTTLFDAGIDMADPDHPRIYLVMERVAGVDLRRRLREGPLSSTQVMNLGSDLAQGLEAVHEHGFLHRDVKPANVLLTRRGPSSRIRGKLTDFGIASMIGVPDDSEFTNGTAAYLGPEQVEGAEPSAASDVYALGLVLLEALTAATAFPGDVEQTVLARLREDPAIPDSVPGPLARVLRAMTDRRPGDRPSPADTAVALQDAFLAGLVRGRRVDPDLLTEGEPERLAAVRRYNLLDTAPDEAIDRVARLARHSLDVPIALVSVVDAEREWFKSRDGLAVEQVDRGVAFGTASVSSGEPWTTSDLRTGADADAHPLLAADPALRSYASAPLVTYDGHTIGTLAVLDRRPREFTDRELEVLGDLAAVLIRDLDLRLLGRSTLFDR